MLVFRLSVPPLIASVITVAVFACSQDEGKPTTGTGSGTGTGTGSGSGTRDDSAAATDAGGGSDGGKKKVAEVGCTDGAGCESGVCFTGNAQSFCTLACTPENAPTVCVAPLTGSCNRQGFCKRD